MPNIYTRKGNVHRGNWSSRALQDALTAVANGTMGLNEVARNFGIPATALKRRK